MHVSEASWQVSAKLRRVNWLLSAAVVEARLRFLQRIVKAGFDPNQPRVPVGSPDGGQWTGTGGGGGDTQVAQTLPRGGGGGSGSYRLRSGRSVEFTPAEEARAVAAEAEAARLRRQVEEIDPVWKPSAMPKCIAWVENNTLPPNTFPVPHDPIVKANLWKGPRPRGY